MLHLLLGALLWLYLAEVGWQLPLHPASAMFVSNHPSLEVPRPDPSRCSRRPSHAPAPHALAHHSMAHTMLRHTPRQGTRRAPRHARASPCQAKEGLRGCQPTASIYWGGAAYDWLCCFSNYHTEHHDFPDVYAAPNRLLAHLAPRQWHALPQVCARRLRAGPLSVCERSAITRPSSTATKLWWGRATAGSPRCGARLRRGNSTLAQGQK